MIVDSMTGSEQIHKVATIESVIKEFNKMENKT